MTVWGEPVSEPLASRSPLARGAVIRLLILEDVPEDAELEQRLLSRAGIAFEALRSATVPRSYRHWRHSSLI